MSVTLLVFQVGKEVSITELGSHLSLNKGTVERYLDLLEKVFVLFNIRGFSRNLRKEVSKTSKYYTRRILFLINPDIFPLNLC